MQLTLHYHLGACVTDCETIPVFRVSKILIFAEVEYRCHLVHDAESNFLSPDTKLRQFSK